ncbi:3-dehydroquinate synthase [Candidatus Latescibacterota bacterium]
MQKVMVEYGDRSYDIIIEGGSLPRLGSFVKDIFGKNGLKIGLITTEKVAGLYLDMAFQSLSAEGFDVTKVIVPDGEEYKTIAVYEIILTKLIESRFERKSVIIPLGGGVIGDMAGFVAATLLRSIPFVQVPTTIVSQADSSIGGKVAVDHALGKNLIGCFYQPRGVWIDTHVLSTLEPREVISGMAEVVKHAIIRDSEFFEFLENNLESIMKFEASDDIMERFIAWNCRIKASVVSEDERESGLRAILNYGHTVGHALETVTGYTRFKHGEAVILGMIAAAGIAVKRKLISPDDISRQNKLLERVGINRDLSGISKDKIFQAMFLDKKVLDGKIRFVLPDSIGSVKVYDDVSEEEIISGIQYLFDYVNE